MNYTDYQLIEIIKNEIKALNHGIQFLYTAHYPSIRKIILANGGNESKAADIFQEALIILYVKIRGDEFDNSFTIAQFLAEVSKGICLKKINHKSLQSTANVDKVA